MVRKRIRSCPGCEALKREVALLKEVVHELGGVFARLEEENRSLRAQLNLSSRNSSKPPSSDPPGTEKPKRKPSERKPGGQPGHEGKTRELLPPEEVDHFVPLRPDCCGRCGVRLPKGIEDPTPLRHQVTEIPPVKPEVTEYQLHAAFCACCGAVTRAGLPDGVPAGAFGPRLTAVVAVLSGAYRLSKRNVEQILADLYGVKVALGSVVNLERRVSEVLADRVEELRESVRRSVVVHADETSWRIGGRKAWLWAAVTAFAAVFLIRKSRAQKVAKELLGEAPGVVISDRYSGYGWIPVRRRQACWAHLIRDFRKIESAGGEAAAIGEALGECADELFHHWHRVKEGTLKRSSFRVYASRLRAEVRNLLLDGATLEHEKVAGMCKEILKVESALWTFVRVAGVEPTNNAAEQAVRPAVIWRKTSFGTQSKRGSEFVERILSTVATLRIQGRNVLEYLTDACRAALQGEPTASFLRA